MVPVIPKIKKCRGFVIFGKLFCAFVRGGVRRQGRVRTRMVLDHFAETKACPELAEEDFVAWGGHPALNYFRKGYNKRGYGE